MSDERPKSSGLVTTLAVLNLVFGLLCGCSGLATLVMMPLMGPIMRTGMAQAQADIERQRKTQLDALELEIQEAKDEGDAAGEATAIAARDKWLKSSPTIDLTGFMDKMFGPAFMAYTMADGGLGFLTNLFLAAAGFGMLTRRRWGRTLAMGVAATKILIAAGLAGTFFLVVGPAMGDAMESFMAEIAKSAPAGQGPPPGMMTAQMQLISALQGGFGLVVASIYPIVLLLVLVSRGVRSEFAEWEAFRAAGGEK